MLKYVVDETGKIVSSVEATPACGHAYCAECGVCVACFSSEPCRKRRGGHRWVEYPGNDTVTYVQNLGRIFKSHHLGPARTSHRGGGKMSCTWHVDDDDDRYVEMTTSRYADEVVLLARDGFLGSLRATILSDVAEVLVWVRERLEAMAEKPSPRGRPT